MLECACAVEFSDFVLFLLGCLLFLLFGSIAGCCSCGFGFVVGLVAGVCVICVICCFGGFVFEFVGDLVLICV